MVWKHYGFKTCTMHHHQEGTALLMDFNPGDAVQVFDGDENAWFDGFVEDSTVVKHPSVGNHEFYVVRLYDGPVQFGMQVRVMAVPFDRPEWIRRPE